MRVVARRRLFLVPALSFERLFFLGIRKVFLFAAKRTLALLALLFKVDLALDARLVQPVDNRVLALFDIVTLHQAFVEKGHGTDGHITSFLD